MSKNLNFYNLLTESNKELFDKIENHEILGASYQLEIIANMFLDVVKNCLKQNIPLRDSIKLVESLAEHYVNTRGNASRAIYNGILTMVGSINKENLENNKELLIQLQKNIECFNRINKENLINIKKYADTELNDYQNIFLYDYSSTVEKSIAELAENNSKNFNIYISESSAIDGGKPFFRLNKYKNINIVFFPDAALYYFLAKCDSCLMGAETFFPDGTGFNTIGSDMVGKLCYILDVPLYFITPLNKLDIRRIEGYKKDLVYIDYKEKYKDPNCIEDDFRTSIPELIAVKPQHIYAYICEKGIIPSNQMFSISLEYDKNLRRGSSE